MTNRERKVIATLTYGEETRTPNHSWDTGTCISGRGVTPRANPGGCAAFAPYMKAWCDYNDPYCCAGSPNPDSSIHYTYPKKYGKVPKHSTRTQRH